MTRDLTWPPARAVAIDRDLGRCGMCGEAAQEVNHRVPRGMGGSSDPQRHAPSRLLSVCRTCHDRYERQDRRRGYDLGFFVPRGITPALHPVLYRGRWALLTDLGTITWVTAY